MKLQELLFRRLKPACQSAGRPSVVTRCKHVKTLASDEVIQQRAQCTAGELLSLILSVAVDGCSADCSLPPEASAAPSSSADRIISSECVGKRFILKRLIILSHATEVSGSAKQAVFSVCILNKLFVKTK